MNIQKKISNSYVVFSKDVTSLDTWKYFDDVENSFTQWIPSKFDLSKPYCTLCISGLSLGSTGGGNGTVKINQAWQPVEPKYSSYYGDEFSDPDLWPNFNKSNDYYDCNYISSLYYALSTDVNATDLKWEYLGNKTLTISSSTVNLNGSDNAYVYLISKMGSAIEDIDSDLQGQIQIQKLGSDTIVVGSGYLDSLTWGDDYSQWCSEATNSSNPEKYHVGFQNIKTFLFKNSYFTTLPTNWVEKINGHYKGIFQDCEIGTAGKLTFKPAYNYQSGYGYSSPCTYTNTFKNIENCKSLYLDFTSLNTAQMEFYSSSFAVGTSVTYVQLDYSSSKGFGYTWFTNDNTSARVFEIYDESEEEYICNISPTATIVINIPAGEDSDYLTDYNNFTPVANMKGFLPKGFKGTVKFPNLTKTTIQKIKNIWTGSGTANPNEDMNNYITFVGKDGSIGGSSSGGGPVL